MQSFAHSLASSWRIFESKTIRLDDLCHCHRHWKFLNFHIPILNHVPMVRCAKCDAYSSNLLAKKYISCDQTWVITKSSNGTDINASLHWNMKSNQEIQISSLIINNEDLVCDQIRILIPIYHVINVNNINNQPTTGKQPGNQLQPVPACDTHNRCRQFFASNHVVSSIC